MNPRIYGMEMEYGTIRRNQDGQWAAGCSDAETWVEHDMQRVLGEHLQYYFIHEASAQPTFNQFTENGARIYFDLSHLEYATPECSTPQEAVAAESAGGALLQEWFQKPIRDEHRIVFIKENLGFAVRSTESAVDVMSPLFDEHLRVVSFACHENYSVDGRKVEKQFFGVRNADGCVPADFLERALDRAVPFFLTRQLVSGAGTFIFGSFELSGRSRFINASVSAQATEGHRAILCTKGEALGSGQRLQVIVGEATMAEVSTLLKLGTTGLVLSLVEDGHIPPAWALAEGPNAVVLLKQISADPTGTRVPIALWGGDVVTAVGMQRRFLDLARRHYPRRDAPRFIRRSTNEILRWWEYVVARLEAGASDELVGVLDWPTKRMLGARLLDSYGISANELPEGIFRHPKRQEIVFQLRALEQRYHELSQNGYYERLKQGGVMQTCIKPAVIARLKKFPPRRTRAWARGSIIRWGNRRPYVRVTAGDDWMTVSVRVLPRRVDMERAQIDMKFENPFNPLPLLMQEFFRTIATKYPAEEAT